MSCETSHDDGGGPSPPSSSKSGCVVTDRRSVTMTEHALRMPASPSSNGAINTTPCARTYRSDIDHQRRKHPQASCPCWISQTQYNNLYPLDTKHPSRQRMPQSLTSKRRFPTFRGSAPMPYSVHVSDRESNAGCMSAEFRRAARGPLFILYLDSQIAFDDALVLGKHPCWSRYRDAADLHHVSKACKLQRGARVLFN